MALKYSYKDDYKNNEKIVKVGEGHAKYEQCMYVVNQIMLILNTNRYNDLQDFIENNYTLEIFLKNNPNIQTALKHVNTFGNPINEKDYEQIKTRLQEITKLKESIETKDIKTTTIDDNQYNSMKIDNKVHYVDTSNSDKSIEEKMKDMQSSQNDFQTTDTKNNSENIFKELEDKQETLNLKDLRDVDYNSLTEEEKELFEFAMDYQLSTPLLIKADIKKGIIVDEENNVMKISKNNGEISITKEENGVQKQESTKLIENNDQIDFNFIDTTQNDEKENNTLDEVVEDIEKKEEEKSLEKPKEKIEDEINTIKENEFDINSPLLEEPNFEDDNTLENSKTYQKKLTIGINNNNVD